MSVVTLAKALLSGINGGLVARDIAGEISGVAGVVSSSSKPMNEGAGVDADIGDIRMVNRSIERINRMFDIDTQWKAPGLIT